MRVWLTFPFCSSSGSCVSKKLLTIYDFFFSLKEEEDGEDTVIRVFKAFPSASGLESPNEKKKKQSIQGYATFFFVLFILWDKCLYFLLNTGNPQRKIGPKGKIQESKLKNQ